MFRLGALLLGGAAACAHAQGGPPFLTDDPGTPGNGRWEINVGWAGERGPGGGEYEAPNVDMNYGLGERIQLKYELPAMVTEERPRAAEGDQPARPGRVIGGVGKSLAGVKWRFFELPASELRLTGERGGAEEEPRFALSTYPQVAFDNPTNSVKRGVVEAGREFFLPIEASGQFGWLRWAAEAGYHFGNRAEAQRWVRGLLVGREFGERTEVYAELYDSQDATRAGGEAKQRSATLGLGGRRALSRDGTLTLLVMGGRSFQAVTAENGQPGWVAYVGFQRLVGARGVR